MLEIDINNDNIQMLLDKQLYEPEPNTLIDKSIRKALIDQLEA